MTILPGVRMPSLARTAECSSRYSTRTAAAVEMAVVLLEHVGFRPVLHHSVYG